MSLVPYHPFEDREIVLRHNNALVVRNPVSRRLEIQRLTECPTCHQSLHNHSSPSPDRDRRYDVPSAHDSFVSPNYFRLLQAGLVREPSEPNDADLSERPPSSPVRRLTHRVPHVEPAAESENVEADVEPVSSSTQVQDARDAPDASAAPGARRDPESASARIRKSAFSPNYFADFFIEERELGRGGKGVVLLVRHQIDGVLLGHYACKRVPVGDDHAWLEKVLVEVELLATLSHPNLVAYRHVWLEEVQLNRFGPPVVCAFILQQYCNGGDLLQYVIGAQPKETTKEELKAQMRRRSKGGSERPKGLSPPTQRHLPFEEIYSIFRDITSGLVFLHESNYVHRDLKPSNCLLHRHGKTMTCLISDFGEVQQAKAMRNSTGSTGTISYCAPEVLIRDATGQLGNFTTKSDIFSLGMILYFLCFGRLPYRSANTVQEELEDIEMLRAEIADWKGFQDERRERPDLPPKLYHLLKKLLAINPAERPSANEVLSVMKTESVLDGLSRGPRSVSPAAPIGLGLAGRRIQNLDSPVPPSTPVPDPLKHSPHAGLSSSPTREDGVGGIPEMRRRSEDVMTNSPQPTAHNSIQKHANPTITRHRPPAMATSRSHDGYSRSSPGPEPAHQEGLSSAMSPVTLPLLMAPPSTPLEQARHEMVVAWHHATQLLGRNADLVTFCVRLALFAVKMVSLGRPCWPFMVNLGVGAPLVAVAAMDLGMPAAPSNESSGGTGGSSSRGSPHTAGTSGTSGTSGVDGSAGRQQEASDNVASLFKWDWRASVTLLALHFFILWATSRWGKLCAGAALA